MENKIKKRKQLTHVHLKDGRILVSESSPAEIYAWINENSHIMIQDEIHSKYDIVSAVFAKIDNLESFIVNQPKEIQTKLREKKKRLLSHMNKEMTYEYAVNFVENIK